MDAIFYLFLANIVIWLGLGFYIIFIARQQAQLKRRLENLETQDNDN